MRRTLEILLVIAVSVGIGVGVVYVAGALNGQASGTDGAAWLEAVATLGALLAATAAAIFAARVYVLEARRDDRFLQAEREKQASLVAVWGELEPKKVIQDGRYKIIGGRAKLQIRNASPLPVTSLVISATVVVAARTATGQLGTDEAYPHVGPVRHTGYAAPMHDPLPVDISLLPIASELDELAKAKPDIEFAMLLTLSFVDAAGRRWQRDSDGSLTEITDEPVE